jgi:hypothetical protein
MLGGGITSSALGLVLGFAAPDEAPVELQWRAPDECPPSANVRDQITRFVADGAPTGTVDRVKVDAVIVKSGDRYVLELDLQLPTGALHKRIEADKCEVLASATALVMAVMLDPTAVVETVDRPTAAPQPPPVVAAPKPSPPPPPKKKERRARGIVRVLAAGSFGALPGFGGAFGGSIGARIGRARVEATAFGELPQRERQPQQRRAGADLDLWTVGARGCFAPAVKRVDFPLCAGVEGGQMRARGFGLQLPRRAAAPWLAFPVGAAVMWAPVPAFAFGGGVDGWVAATQPAFEIEDLGPVHTARRAGVRIHAGVEVRFP